MPVLSRFHGIILRIPKLLPHVENLQAVFGLFKGLHPFVLRVQQGDGRLLAVIFRPGRSEVRILPVSPRAAPYGVLLLVRPGGFEQPVPRGLANPFGHVKKRIAMYFCNALFVLLLFRFRIILVAYHLRHQCIALLPVDHFSTDLWYFA